MNKTIQLFFVECTVCGHQDHNMFETIELLKDHYEGEKEFFCNYCGAFVLLDLDVNYPVKTKLKTIK